MGAIWCASDLHLTTVEDPVFDRFLRFVDQIRADASELWLLGDVFEAYLGDDDDDPVIAAVARTLGDLAARGVSIRFGHGNRDFLVGQDYLARCGAQLLAEVEIREHAGRRLAFLHGDTLCSDDHAYQQVRAQLRSPAWQAQFRAQALTTRRAFAAHARAQSRTHTAMASAAIMDVNPNAVEALFASTAADWIIHGHTHRPAIHRHGARRRIVLGDWPHAPSWLRIGADGAAELVFEGQRLSA